MKKDINSGIGSFREWLYSAAAWSKVASVAVAILLAAGGLIALAASDRARLSHIELRVDILEKKHEVLGAKLHDIDKKVDTAVTILQRMERESRGKEK